VYTPEEKTKNIVYSKAHLRVSFKLNWRRSKARRVQLVINKRKEHQPYD
jgi:hypothetical protein